MYTPCLLYTSLDAYITDADRENYLYLDKGFIKGKQYTMPFIVGNARILDFNRDILEQAGVTELPATWQDLVDVAVKIKEAGLPGVMPFEMCIRDRTKMGLCHTASPVAIFLPEPPYKVRLMGTL